MSKNYETKEDLRDIKKRLRIKKPVVAVVSLLTVLVIAFGGVRYMSSVDFAFEKTVDITPAFLKKHGIKGLILDIDNTLTTHDNPYPAEGIAEWLDTMKKSGIKLIIVSNNHSERVKPFAQSLGLDFVSDSGKPSKKGYISAMEKMGLSSSETAAVGDQLFTDVWGAKNAGATMLYVKPIEIEPESKRFIRFKRVLEKPFLPKKFVRAEKEEI